MAADGWTRDCARIGILIGKTKTRPNRPIPPPPQFPEFRIQSASDHRFLNRSIAFDSINPADYLGLGLRLGPTSTLSDVFWRKNSAFELRSLLFRSNAWPFA